MIDLRRPHAAEGQGWVMQAILEEIEAGLADLEGRLQELPAGSDEQAAAEAKIERLARLHHEVSNGMVSAETAHVVFRELGKALA
jgi:hypothetical protein